MKTKLERLALEHISDLANEARSVVLQNNENMGMYSHRESGFGKLNEKLSQIERWTEAVLEGA